MFPFRQVLNLLADLKDEYSLTLLFISHDLKVVNHFCDRLLVMYLGYVVESSRCDDLYTEAVHPYTKALLERTLFPTQRLGRS
ncbi:MAG: hypothetical protein R3B96_03690 [Pirellulaceae bacterium]